MNYITTTQLRTETPELLAALYQGEIIDLIHRSQVIGEIRPKSVKRSKLFNPEKFDLMAKNLSLKPISYKQSMKIYRKHLMDKYGKNIS